MKRKLFSILSDLFLVLGLIAIVAGIAIAGNLPLAIGAAGVELILLGIGLAVANLRTGGEDG